MNRLEDVGIEKLFENLAQITVSPRTLQNITDVNLNNLGISSKKQKVELWELASKICTTILLEQFY